MAKTERRGKSEADPEVEAIMAASSGASEWLHEEFAGVDLGDKRLDRRLIKTAKLLGQSPMSPINEACGNWASTQAAYRLFDNEKAEPEAIRAPHLAATVKRMLGSGGPILVVQDTVFLSYGKHPKTQGLGSIGKSNEAHDRGLIMHNALAFTTGGVPLGILSQTTWARRDIVEEDGTEKVLRLQCTAIEEKESSKWLVALRETRAHKPKGVQVVTLADRESDFYEFLAEAQEHSERYVIRARWDRSLVSEDSECCESILEALTDAPVLGRMDVKISSNGKRKARTAHVEVKCISVTLSPPKKRGKAMDSGCTDPITVRVIGATESDPPAGQEAISWVLLTNLLVPDFASACEKVTWYTRRWGIETWHKVLKSGCQVEECMLQSGERLTRFLTLFSILAVRLMHVTFLAREEPDLPATQVFAQEELEALHVRVHKRLPTENKMTLREVVRMIGGLGGHLGRKCDGEPGITVLWRGWMKLYEDVVMLSAAKQALGLADSS
jgi:Transposase DNA-binding/Transposase Tn5 dimerisation domain